MPGREAFDHRGTREANPKNTPKDFDRCRSTEGTEPLPGFWDRVHDASNIYSVLRAGAILAFWTRLSKEF